MLPGQRLIHRLSLHNANQPNIVFCYVHLQSTYNSTCVLIDKENISQTEATEMLAVCSVFGGNHHVDSRYI